MKEKQRRQLLKSYEREKTLNLMAKPGAHQVILVLDHLKPDFNVGKIFRMADAFGAHEVHLVGISFFHPGPAKGSLRHVPAKFYEQFSESYRVLKEQGYSIFALEPSDSRDLWSVQFPEKSAFVLGHEQFGLSFGRTDFEGIEFLKIPQFGKVQSLNVSIAASVTVYEYVRQRHTCLSKP